MPRNHWGNKEALQGAWLDCYNQTCSWHGSKVPRVCCPNQASTHAHTCQHTQSAAPLPGRGSRVQLRRASKPEQPHP